MGTDKNTESERGISAHKNEGWCAQIRQQYLPVQDKRQQWAHVKKNSLFLFSAAAFWLLNFMQSPGYIWGFFIGMGILTVCASQVNDMRGFEKGMPLWMRLTALFSTVSVCWNDGMAACIWWRKVFQKVELLLIQKGIALPAFLRRSAPPSVAILITVCAGWFLYLLMAYLWREIIGIFSSSILSEKISRPEIAAYAILWGLLTLFSGAVFLKTNAFYNGAWDVVYTADTPLFRESGYGGIYYLVFTSLGFKHALLGIFSAPFLSIPCMIGYLLGSMAAAAILANSIQLLLLLFASFLLAKSLHLRPTQRICFILLLCCSYSYLFFSLAMEQYILSFFWLSVLFYQICAKGKPDKLVLWGAGGTTLTSIVLLPFLSDKRPLKNIKGWCGDCIQYGLEFVVVLCAVFRFNIFYDFKSAIQNVATFSGVHITWTDKTLQFLASLKDYFLAPHTEVIPDWWLNIWNPAILTFDTVQGPVWHLAPVTTVCWFGVVILILSALSAWLNRKEKVYQMAALWAAFSVAILWIGGWGTAENGMNLYGLYFNWAFYILLFGFFKKLGKILHSRYLLYIVSAICGAGMLYTNIPAIGALIRFAIEYYPA